MKRAGTVEVYYSHWGALGLLADLLKGPSAVVEWLKDCTKDEQLIDNVFSEGIALTDVDDQLLLLRGGVCVRHILPVRLAYLEMLRASWPAWRVEWADRGVLDVAERVGLPTTGLDLKPLACPSDAELQKPGHLGSFTWVTLVGDVTEDFAFGLQPGELLLVGPRLLDYCKKRVPGQLPIEDNLGGGLLLKPANRYLGWWSAGDLQPAAADVAAAWPDWQIGELPQAFRDQVAGSGRDPSGYMLSTERIRQYIADELFPGVEPDPVAGLRRLEARMREAGQGPMVNPEALEYPRPRAGSNPDEVKMGGDWSDCAAHLAPWVPGDELEAFVEHCAVNGVDGRRLLVDLLARHGGGSPFGSAVRTLAAFRAPEGSPYRVSERVIAGAVRFMHDGRSEHAAEADLEGLLRDMLLPCPHPEEAEQRAESMLAFVEDATPEAIQGLARFGKMMKAQPPE